MLKSYKKVIEYLSSIWNLIRSDIPALYGKVVDMEADLRRMSYSTQYAKNEIIKIENHLFQKDTEMIIHNGKRYRIAESQLTVEAGERAILDLHCAECDDE